MGGEVPQMKTLWELLPTPPYRYPGGYNEADKAIYRYAYPSSGYPDLIIDEPIYSKGGGVLLPGYYEIILAYDRKTLVLMQSGKIIATIPVFKFEIAKEAGKQIMDSKELKQEQKKEKKLAKKNKKREKDGKEPIKNELYMSASMEYDIGKACYIIKYERGEIKAWGAIKDGRW